MAEEFQEKTEQATGRKKQRAREKGQVPRNRELTSMAAMGGILMMFYFIGEYSFTSLSTFTGSLLSMRYGLEPMNVSRVAIIEGARILFPFLFAPLIFVTLASVAQGGFVFKTLEFDIEKINPLNGIKKIFSMSGAAELLKSLLKFAIGGWVIYYVVKKDLKALPMLSAMELNVLVRISTKMIVRAVGVAFFYYLIVALVSYAVEKWQFERSLRMTKQEIKEEHKEMEGDPLIKSRIRTIQRETARKRMMQEVPKATVVITNPTHLAVALQYEDKKMFAPKIVAKGAGVVAEKIKEIAAEYGVPIVEDKPLARALFKHEIDTFVPEELYVAVARILAYIYKLKGKK
ncbi:MAG: flagellar biosynthesis protein FlhB [Nitrospirae bacterium]|nr:flagellar biosynthesis protein FlhB [Nitrospirota bacterium]